MSILSDIHREHDDESASAEYTGKHHKASALHGSRDHPPEEKVSDIHIAKIFWCSDL